MLSFLSLIISLFVFLCVGVAAGGDSSEAEPGQPGPPAGGGKEHLAGAAGGGRGGTTQPGETAADSAGSGMRWRTRPCIFTNIN